MSCCYPITKLFKKEKKTAENNKSSEPQGQEQYKVNKQHNYDEVDLDQASREPNWDVEKKPRNYDQVDIGGNQSEQRSRKQGVGQLNYIDVEFTDKPPTKPKMSVSEKEASKVTYSEVTVDAMIYENQ